jgi:signal transduction histidine kinase
VSAWRSAVVAAEAQAAFQEWRGRAAQVMLILFGVALVPHLGSWLLGYALPGGWWVVITVVMLVLVTAGVVARAWPPIVRVWLLLLVAYLASVHGLILYTGAMARVWLLGAPIVALILAGPRSGLVAVFLSVGLIFLHAVAAWTGVTDSWHVAGFDESSPSVVIARAVSWLGFFVPVMILIRSAHVFHLRTLAAEREVTARLEEEIAERRVAHESLARAAGERERFEREIARVGDDERRRLGHDLHDGANQQLAVALLRCAALEDRLATEYPQGVADMRALGEIIEATMDEVHEVARALAPVEMDPEALGPALGALARRTAHSFGVPCVYRESGDVRLPDRERTLDLYRIAQEALTNAGKHAQARRIMVTLDGEDGEVLLSVEDDGTGVSGGADGTGLGLRIMAFRANRMGGTLSIEPAPTGGTRLVCQVPRGAHV